MITRLSRLIGQTVALKLQVKFQSDRVRDTFGSGKIRPIQPHRVASRL